MIKANIAEAKARLAHLVKKAQQGEVVFITSGHKKTPVARLEAVRPTAKKRLGLLEGKGIVLPEEFFEPLPEDEQRLWNGETARTGLS